MTEIHQPSSQNSHSHRQTFSKKTFRLNTVATSLLFLVIVFLVATSGFLYKTYTDEKKKNDDLQSQLITDPTLSQKAQEAKALNVVDNLKSVLMIEDIKDKDGNAIKPAVATIQDKDKVKQSNPEFYKFVENGDYLIVYPSRAIIFRDSEKKIINIAPIITPPEQGTSPAPASTGGKDSTPANAVIKK